MFFLFRNLALLRRAASKPVCSEEGERWFERLVTFWNGVLGGLSLLQCLTSQAQHCLALETRLDQSQAIWHGCRVRKVTPCTKLDFDFHWQEPACKLCPVMPALVVLRTWSTLVVQAPESAGPHANACWSAAKAVDLVASVTRHRFFNLT